MEGDKVEVDLYQDVGFKQEIKHNVILRLFGINAPEIVGEGKAQGIAATEWLRDRLFSRPFSVITLKPDKYGDRYLALLIDRERAKSLALNVLSDMEVLYELPGKIDKFFPETVNSEVIRSGHAKPWDGTGKKP